MNEINTEIAFRVILPKLQHICSDAEIKTVAELRKKFNEEYKEAISAAKFQEWIDLLGVKFTRKVVIQWPDTHTSRPDTRALSEGWTPQKPIPDDDLAEQQDEISDDFPPTPASAMRVDAFNQM